MLHEALAAFAREHSGQTAPLVVLADRPDATVVRVGDVVAKAHAPGTQRALLALRLELAASPPLGSVLLPPFTTEPRNVDGRLATLWPFAQPLHPARPDEAPWEAAGDLLCRLHAQDTSALGAADRAPSAGANAKVLEAMRRLRTGNLPLGAVVERAFAGLPPALREGASSGHALVHGDFHLGQLARVGSTLLLIDVDDLGRGDPAWDLARPAAWFAVGLLAPDDWAAFIEAYGAGVGRSVSWNEVDAFARALVVQTAARAIVAAAGEQRDLDEIEHAFIEACERMT